jgi:hypothetical protein
MHICIYREREEMLAEILVSAHHILIHARDLKLQIPIQFGRLALARSS